MTYSTISRCGRTISESVVRHWSAAPSQLVTSHMPPPTPPTKYYLATAKYLTYYLYPTIFFATPLVQISFKLRCLCLSFFI